MQNHRLHRLQKHLPAGRQGLTQIILSILTYVLMAAKCCAQQESLTTTAYYPPPYGVYQELKISPTNSSIACNSTTEGMLYYNSTNSTLMLCTDRSGAFQWEAVRSEDGSNVTVSNWVLDANTTLYTNDTPQSQNWSVGIGTTTPNARLQVNGAISRQGTTLLGANPDTHVNLGVESTTGPGDYATISGGYGHTAEGNYSTVSGGMNNFAGADYSTVSGGRENFAMGLYSTVSGGRDNNASGDFSLVSGGRDNNASGDFSAVSGGYANTASGEYSIVSGGAVNTASGSYATAAGGSGNQAVGNFSMVSGGSANTAQGDYSWAGGRRAKANHLGSFVWADANDADYTSNGIDTFNVRAQGGFYFDNGALGNNETWADVAEFMDVAKEEKVQEAELVCVIADKLLGKSQKPYAENLIGVVSGTRTVTLHLGSKASSSEATIRLPIALAGQVYVKVCDEAGAINLGDPITSSSIPGVGMKATQPGKIIGTALQKEEFKDSPDAEILVFVNLGYYAPAQKYAALSAELNTLEENISALSQKNLKEASH